MLTISEIETRPLGYLDYHTASRRGKRKAKLPPLCGRVREIGRASCRERV